MKFSPIDIFTKYANTKNFKNKRINLKPTVVDGKVFDFANELNILPSELLLIKGHRKSIVKIRYNKESSLKLELLNDMLKLYKNEKVIDIEIDFVLKNVILDNFIYLDTNKTKRRVGDYVDVVGIDRVSILFFEGCYNWNCGKPCKFCDLHPKLRSDEIIKPTTNNLGLFNYDVKTWWDSTRVDYLKGLELSLRALLKYDNNNHLHLFFMAGNLPDINNTWYVVEDLISDISRYLDLSRYDTILNVAPHSNLSALKKIKELGIRQVQYNLEVANEELFNEICPGKISYNIFIQKLKEAVSIFGYGNVRTNFVFGLQNKDELINEIENLAKFGVVSDYSVFQPKRNTTFQNKEAPKFQEVIDFTEQLVDIYHRYNFKPIFCSVSSRSSIVNEVYEDRYKRNIQ